MSTPTITRLDLPNMTTIVDGSIAATVEQDIMAGPCRLYGLIASGITEINYLKLYDNQEPTAGTTAPDLQFQIPLGGTIELIFPEPLIFENGLSYLADQSPGTAVGAVGSGASCTFTLKEGVS